MRFYFLLITGIFASVNNDGFIHDDFVHPHTFADTSGASEDGHTEILYESDLTDDGIQFSDVYPDRECFITIGDSEIDLDAICPSVASEHSLVEPQSTRRSFFDCLKSICPCLFSQQVLSYKIAYLSPVF
jgi:hypothetical protein